MMKAVYPMPFPYSLKNGKVVVNEKCACGAFRTEHEDSLAPGHGGLERTKCLKFTWIGYVFRPELVEKEEK